MKRNQLIGFAVLILGGLLVINVFGTLIAWALRIAVVAGLAFLGYSYFKKG